ncbi:MAG: hypothetical protein V4687_02345 [Bacteroidota bacterium]
MKNKYQFNSLKDLQSRQLALKTASELQGNLILQDSKSYINDLSVTRLFSKGHSTALPIKLRKPDNNELLSGKILSFAIPMLLNKTVFKKSGIITKSVVGLMSGKTGTRIGAYLASFISGKQKRKFL